MMNTYKITIQPSDIHYDITVNHSILDAALAKNVFLQHSCKKGSCGTCKADVVAGLVKDHNGNSVVSGNILTCKSYALSDVILKANYYPELSNIQSVLAPCKVSSIRFVSKDIVVLTLRLPSSVQFRYLPGQYIDLIYGNIRRSYSIANAQLHSASSELELHIRLLPEGEMSQVLTQCSINQLLRLEGPKGTFFIREADNPILFLAGGTGFAPVKAMVEQLLSIESQRQIYIYWGMPNSASLYTNIGKLWADSYDNVQYVPVISSHDSTWQGRTGLVHQAVVDDFSDLNEFHVYACGSAPMIDAAKNAFFTKGLSEAHFYSDIFVASK